MLEAFEQGSPAPNVTLGAGVPADDLAPRARIGVEPRLTLDLSGADAFGQLAWLHWAAAFMRAVVGAGEVVVEARGLLAEWCEVLPDAHRRGWLDDVRVVAGASDLGEREDFAFASSAAVVSLPLVRTVGQVHVRADGPPPPWIEPDGAATGVGEAVAAAGRDDVEAAYERWRGQATTPVPRASLITSVFDGDRYLTQFLANAAGLEGYDACEHLLIRAGSPGNEHAELMAHVQRHPGAVYVNLATDPGLYAVWNLGVQLARAPYLSNANLDDRRASAQLERMCRALDGRPDVDVASARLRITHEPNTDWPELGDGRLMFGDVPAGTYAGADLLRDDGERLRSRNLPHCMPVWRRELHAKHGFFDEARFGPSADWEFWLRAGSGGARFYFADEPLGAFLRTPDSYWQQGSGGFDYDARIAAFYRGLWDGTGGVLPQPWPALEELRTLRDRGAYLELTGRFAALADEARAANGGERPAAVDALAQRLFGLADAVAFDRLRGIRSLDHPGFYAALRALALDVCDGGATGSATLSWLSALVREGLNISGDWDWHLVRARVLGFSGDCDGEHELLRALHAADRDRFWRTVQPVYRFTITLERLAELVDDPVQAPDRDWPRPATCDLCFYPDYRDGNVYQARFYAGFEEHGGHVVGTSDPSRLLDRTPAPGRELIVHIHWDDAVHKKWDGPVARHRRTHFLAMLRRLRARGCWLFWTVHNRLSHECKDPDAERAFRRELYELADRVYVHHPLVAGELDWLPDWDKLCLAEHGPYPVISRDRAHARDALGIGPDQRVLLHFGQVRAYKALEQTLPVLRRALDRHPELTVAVVGRIRVSEVRAYLREHPHPRLVVDDDAVSDEYLADCVAAADGGFLSYRDILTSGALFHMLSYGLPSIAPALGTIPAYVDDGWNGYRYASADELEAAVSRFMALSADELKRLQASAYRTAAALAWRFP